MNFDGRDRVFVVSIGSGTPAWSTISWRDIINERRRYFHPVGRGWPKEPLKFIGFRYDARLQSIHRIEDVIRIECRSELPKYFPEIDGDACRRWRDGGKPVPQLLYSLSAPTFPDHVVPSGKVFQAARVWADRDLLLSSNSISEAVELTKKRAVAHEGPIQSNDKERAGETISRAGDAPSSSRIVPPITDAESLLARIRTLQGLPERNNEDVVRELLVRLGHDPCLIVFQRGRIDVSVINREHKELAVFEVKRSIADEIKRDGALRQAHDYAGRTGAEMFIVTDGDQYEIYDRRKGRSYTDMRCGGFRLTAFLEEDCPVLDLLRPSKAE